MIIAAEGLDYAGKSTACEGMTERLGALLYRTPPPSYMAKRNLIDQHATNEEHYQFYLEGVKTASREIALIVSSRGMIILDRYWMTTVAYHRASGVDAKLKDFGNIVLPDWTIYFDVSPEVQEERRLKRAMSACDKRDWEKQSLVRIEYHKLLALSQNATEIKTDSLTPEEVLETALRNLPRTLH